MKKLGSILIFGLTLAFAFAVLTPAVDARSEYEKAFTKKYVGDKSSQVQKDLADAVAEIKKCNVCHNPNKVDGKVSKKNRNPYGNELSKLLTKDDKKNEEKIMKALDTVENMKSDGSETSFGSLIKSGKVPYRYE